MVDSDPHESLHEGRVTKRARTISNLTKEQIQHKRNVDRKAQRAFRQRTKDCIGDLEQRIAQLQKASDEQETRFQVEISRLRRNNVTLLRCLEHIAELGSATARRIRDDIDPDNDPVSHTARLGFEEAQFDNISENPAFKHGFPLEHINVAQDTLSADSTSSVLSDSDGPLGVPQVNAAPGTLQPPAMPSNHFLQSQQRSRAANIPIPYLFEDERAASNSVFSEKRKVYQSPSESCQLPSTTLDSTQSRSESRRMTRDTDFEGRTDIILLTPSSTTAGDIRYNSHSNPTASSASAVLPSHVSPTCPLDQILLDFLNARTEMITKGVSSDTAIGLAKPTVKALLNTELTGSVHPLCAVLSEVLSTFPHVAQTEKLGFFYLMYQMMRWQISPTRETYNAMPIWLRPTVTQITVHHAAWIDNIPWPGVRDMLIENPDDYPFELFSQYYSQNVSINWPFDDLDAVSDIEDDAVLHSIFEKHIGNLKNWTVADDFQTRFPAMTSAMYSRD